MYSQRCLLAALLLVASFPSSTAFAPSLKAKSFAAPTKHHHIMKKLHHAPTPTTTTVAGATVSAKSRSSQSSTTSLQMAPVGIAAFAGAMSGGLFAGSLHAIAGPDHIAALLPRCVGQRWYRASRIGALWGMGHGISATLIGVIAFFVKGRISKVGAVHSILSKASSVTEIAVGLSLVVIGLMGMKEAREWESEMVDGGQPQSLSAAATPAEAGSKSSNQGGRAVVFNGLLHGFTWDGAPSLAPALAMATWGGNLAFLLSYALGTIGIMTIATTVIGEGTRRAGEVFQRPDIPQKLSFYSSILAVAIGVVWCGLALV